MTVVTRRQCSVEISKIDPTKPLTDLQVRVLLQNQNGKRGLSKEALAKIRVAINCSSESVQKKLAFFFETPPVALDAGQLTPEEISEISTMLHECEIAKGREKKTTVALRLYAFLDQLWPKVVRLKATRPSLQRFYDTVHQKYLELVYAEHVQEFKKRFWHMFHTVPYNLRPRKMQ